MDCSCCWVPSRHHLFGRKRPVSQVAMWAHGVAMAPPTLDNDPSLLKAEEDLGVEQLISKPSVEALDLAVPQLLPGMM